MNGGADSTADRGQGTGTAKPTTKYPSVESVGFFLFLSLLFVTPLAEALKNLLIVGLFIWWLVAGNIGRDLRTAPLYVKCFLLFSILPVVTLFTSDLTDAKELISDVKGAVKFGIALLPVYALSMIKKGQEKSVTWLTIILAAGGLVACADSFISWKQTENYFMELRGVGHVNQSALYLTLVAISAIALTWSKKSGATIVGWAALIVSLIFLIPTQSLNAYAALMGVMVFWAFMLMIERRYETILRVLVCIAVVVPGYMLIIPDSDQRWDALKAEITNRTGTRENGASNWSSHRLHLLRTALEIYDRHRWFGVGPDQFWEATTEERIRAELERENRNYDLEKQNFYHTTHGHNVWINVLVERGVSGVVLVALFFALSGYRICRSAVRVLYRKSGDSRLAQLMFLSGATWIMLFVGGLANTTLHLEHGLVGVMLLVWSLTSLELRTASLQGLK